MTKRIWRPTRTLLLAATFVGTLVVAGKTFLLPRPDATTPGTNSLATTVPLVGWQPTGSTALAPVAGLSPGQRLEYRRGATVLTVEARMMPGDGNISRFLFVYTPIRAANAGLIVKHRSDIGHYGLLSHAGRAYLSACVSDRGASTVTEQQFMQSRYSADLRVDRVLPWLLGQHSLLDQRCLWTLMSVPLPPAATADSQPTIAAFNALESAWIAWYRWWQVHFPAD